MTKATHLVLTNPGQYGTALIYDTENETCIPWSPFNDSVPVEIERRFPEQRAPDGLEYSQLPATPADQLLNLWTKNWISLRWMPYSETNGWRELLEEDTFAELQHAATLPHLREPAQTKLVRRSLRGVYISAGWDTEASDLASAKRNLDAEAFDRRRGQWRETTQALLDKAYAEQWAWTELRSALRLPVESSSLLDRELELDASEIQMSRRMGSRPDAGNPRTHLQL